MNVSKQNNEKCFDFSLNFLDKESIKKSRGYFRIKFCLKYCRIPCYRTAFPSTHIHPYWHDFSRDCFYLDFLPVFESV